MKHTILAIAITAVMANTAFAAESEGITLDNGVTVKPTLATGLKYDDNIFSSATDEKSSAIVNVDPAINFSLNDGINQYSLDIGINSGTYLSSSDDNYIDGNVAFTSHLEPSSKHRFDITLMANKVTEPRGTGLAEGLGDDVSEPLEYVDQTVALTYEFGALSTAARIAFDAKYYNKSYNNFTTVTQFNDFDSVKLGSTFFYNTHASTDLFVEVSRDAIRYQHVAVDTTSKSSDDYRALVGVKWEATALTSGTAKLGYQEKDFTESGRENFSGLSWQAGVQWQPLTYSTISFDTARAARDTDSVGDYIDATSFSLAWMHDWNQDLSSNVSASFTNEDYSGVIRTDDITTFSASVNYVFTRWLEASAYVELSSKDSTVEDLTFDKSMIGLNFIFSM
ncbi:outer membrane beta-barrel protein [Colwellia piezophila]|uniref:outer membrane beta-barrel protein n=1 Tax=Colwellia piezophila TaxID=211668 RepID=UPI00037E2349|nr:outer membrane beta-barrel protein [Colwellia piezophila]